MDDPFPTILAHLQGGGHLTRQQSHLALLHLTSGSATSQEIRDFLVALPWQRVTAEELVGAASVMREKVIAIPTEGDTLDTCGTGGDVRHTFNISTAAAIIAAACGIKVVKHGNRSASGRAGSADVLEKLGVGLELTPPRLKECMDKCNICFAFARALHPAMKHVAQIRRELGVPTIFNLLGPLTNPGHASHSLLGVFSPDLTEKVAAAMRELGSRRAWVVHAEDGLDEISTMSKTRISELRNGELRTWLLDAAEVGLPPAALAELQVSHVDEAAAALMEVLNGNPGPRRDIALLNAAAALVIGERADDLASGLAIASAAVDRGDARRTLDDLIRLSSKCP